jgi:HEPN domain-containing protein
MTPSEQPRLLLHKATQDLAVVNKLIDDPAIDDETLGYHAQQAAEKLIKALLAHGGHDYPRSHNIGLLLDLLESHGTRLPERFEDVQAQRRSAPCTATTTCLWMTRRIATAGRRCSTLSIPTWNR